MVERREAEDARLFVWASKRASFFERLDPTQPENIWLASAFSDQSSRDLGPRNMFFAENLKKWNERKFKIFGCKNKLVTKLKLSAELQKVTFWAEFDQYGWVVIL